MDSAKNFEELKVEVEDLLTGLGKFLAELADGGASAGPVANAALDARLGESHRTYCQLRARHREQNLTVAVLALTKSGKSTLLNALIGELLLPSTNVPETARISTVQHVSLGSSDHPTLVYTASDGTKKVVESAGRIYDTLRYLNQEKRGRVHHATDEALLEIKTRIAALENVGMVPKEISLKLLDTPGPNEAGEEALRFQVERLLESVDAVIYLLDYTKLKTQEEANLLKKLRDINPQLFQRLSQRLFFCVNKADAIETTEGMDGEDTKLYVADLITRQLQQESFQLKPEQVLLVSARDALLARLVLNSKASARDLERFRTLAFGRKSAARSGAEMRAKAAEMLDDSGLAVLEDRIFNFLYGQSAPLKLLATVDDSVRLLHQVQNVALASQASLVADMATLQTQISKLQSELGQVLGEFRSLQAEAQDIEGGVVDEVQTRMHTLKEKLFLHVSAVLEATEDSPSSSLVRTGRWKAAWDKAVRFLARQNASSNAQAADLQATLTELHLDIQEQISAEVAEFWHEVELATNVRQQRMFQAVNAHLEKLARAVDDVVGGLLSLRLEPVLVRMEPPSAAEFHSSLQELFEKGIDKVEEHRVVERTEDYVRWEKKYKGLCRNEYYVGTPATRTITEEFNEITYRLEPAKIKDYFMAQVEGRVSASTSYVRAFVHQYIAGRINEARRSIEDYAERYRRTMESALEVHREGEGTRKQAVAAVEAHLAAITALLGQADDLTERVEAQLDDAPRPAGAQLSESALSHGAATASSGADADAAPDLLQAMVARDAPLQYTTQMPPLLTDSSDDSYVSSESASDAEEGYLVPSGEQPELINQETDAAAAAASPAPASQEADADAAPSSLDRVASSEGVTLAPVTAPPEAAQAAAQAEQAAAASCNAIRRLGELLASPHAESFQEGVGSAPIPEHQQEAVQQAPEHEDPTPAVYASAYSSFEDVEQPGRDAAHLVFSDGWGQAKDGEDLSVPVSVEEAAGGAAPQAGAESEAASEEEVAALLPSHPPAAVLPSGGAPSLAFAAEFVEMDNGADSEEPAGPPLLPEHEPSGSEDWTVVDSENEAVTSA